jgi:rod shape-determining protein MreB and related proteins
MSFGIVTSREEAVQAKINIGVIPRADEKILVKQAKLQSDSGPREVKVPQESLAEFMIQNLKPLFDGILDTLEETPPELYEDIYFRGLFLTGGGSRLKGLARLLEERLQIKVNPVEEPELSVIRGIGQILAEFGKFREFFRHHVTF